MFIIRFRATPIEQSKSRHEYKQERQNPEVDSIGAWNKPDELIEEGVVKDDEVAGPFVVYTSNEDTQIVNYLQGTVQDTTSDHNPSKVDY